MCDVPRIIYVAVRMNARAERMCGRTLFLRYRAPTHSLTNMEPLPHYGLAVETFIALQFFKPDDGAVAVDATAVAAALRWARVLVHGTRAHVTNRMHIGSQPSARYPRAHPLGPVRYRPPSTVIHTPTRRASRHDNVRLIINCSLLKII